MTPDDGKHFIIVKDSGGGTDGLLGISGARDITFANNSVVGDLPARAAAFVVERKGDKPLFSDGDADSLANLTLVNNLGAFEAGPSLRGHADLTEIQLQWVNAHEPGATQIVIEYSANDSLTTVELPPTASSYTLTGLRRDTLYGVTLYLRDAQGQILASSNRLWLITSDIHVVLPVTPKDSG